MPRQKKPQPIPDKICPFMSKPVSQSHSVENSKLLLGSVEFVPCEKERCALWSNSFKVCRMGMK